MLPADVIAVGRMIAVAAATGGNVAGEDVPSGTMRWYVYGGVSCVLVVFAGIMSGLTLGLMSLGLVDLEVLQRLALCQEGPDDAALLDLIDLLDAVATAALELPGQRCEAGTPRDLVALQHLSLPSSAGSNPR